MGASYLRYTNAVLTLIVVVLGIFALLQAEGRLRLAWAAALAALLLLPVLGLGPALTWAVWAGKLVFGFASYIYLKSQGFWSFGR
jgi:hypothetical protein